MQADFTDTLFRSPSEDPRVEQLIDYLSRRDWVRARDIHSSYLKFNDRLCRALAKASDGRIISGQNGYKLTIEATPEEIHHAAAWLESQANEMALRARQIRKTGHRALHGNHRCTTPA